MYLPVAEMAINFEYLAILGITSGILSGLFGLGGGIITTPILIFFGIPTPIAIGSSMLQIVGSSIAGTIANLEEKTIDIDLSKTLCLGGSIGAILGGTIFNQIKQQGNIDSAVSILYILTTMIVGILMYADAAMEISNPRQTRHKYQNKVKNNQIKLFAIALSITTLSAMIGIGGGIILIPILTMWIGMPFRNASATTLSQVSVTGAINATIQSYMGNVDIYLAIVLIMAAIVGFKIGSKISKMMPVYLVKIGLATTITALCCGFVAKIITTESIAFIVE